ncbi:substrate-binding periplasmic protein [Chitinilyticum litopenaei]|uniref:substrate-binding periplasmic protein n=1 Tax=Chitinilyticum litopenaei TaxID=1121276 RepID=UPI00042207EE|nr:transporter substrate-binding domain-containing protein [Chitinilyticum litopenaei]
MRILPLLSLAIITVASADSPKICVEDAWPPFAMVEKGRPAGAMVELVAAAYAQSGITPRFESGSYNRCLKLTLQGEYDGLLDVARNSERVPQFVWSTRPILIMKLHLVGHAGLPPEAPSYAAMRGRKVGMTTGYEYPDAMLSQPGLVRVESSSELGNFRQLAQGKIDFMLLSEGTLATMLAALPPAQRKAIRDWGVIDELPLFVAFYKDGLQAEDYSTALDHGLEVVQRSGQQQAIMRKWKAVP